MRSLALFLLLLNVAFLTWQLSLLTWLPWQPEQFTKITKIPSSTISKEPKLNGLNEQSHQSFNATELKPVESTPTQVTPSVEVNPPPSTTQTPVEMGALAVSASVRKPTTTESDTANIAPSEESSVASTVMTSKLQQVAGVFANAEPKPNNDFNSHASMSSKSIQPKNSNSPPLMPNPSNKPLICFQAGPYTLASTAHQVFNWLKKQVNITVYVQDRQTKILESTWVYLPPFENRPAARRAQQHLHQLGIKDYMIVTSGQFNNAISLGRYRQPVNVKQRLKELNAKGYENVKTQKRYKTDTTYWLNVKMPGEQQSELLNLFRKKFPAPKLESVACESIALAAEIP